MHIAFDSSLRIGNVDHPPIAYQKDGLFLRCAGQEPELLYQDVGGSTACPLAWSPDLEWIYHSHFNEVLAIHHRTKEKMRLWTGDEIVTWLLQSCPTTGRLLFRAGSRLVLCEPEGIERTVYRGEFYTLDASLSANQAIVWQKGRLIRVSWASGKQQCLIDADCPGDFALSPDAREIAFACESIQFLSRREFGQLSSCQTEVARPSFSPDGKTIAFMNGDYELWLVRMEPQLVETKLAWVTGEFPTVAQRGSSYASQPQWSSDGRYLIAQLTKCADGFRIRQGGLRTGTLEATAPTEHSSVIVDLIAGVVEIWPGYHAHPAFRLCATGGQWGANAFAS